VLNGGGLEDGQSSTLATLPQVRDMVLIVKIELMLFSFRFLMNGEIRRNLEKDTFN